VQLVHRAFHLALAQRGPDIDAFVDGRFDQFLVFLARPMQHVVDNFLAGQFLFARMADADPQPPEFGGAEALADILQTVVAGDAAAHFQLYLSGPQIELVVHNQYFFRLDLVEPG
jgi:hypothetical protein